MIKTIPLIPAIVPRTYTPKKYTKKYTPYNSCGLVHAHALHGALNSSGSTPKSTARSSPTIDIQNITATPITIVLMMGWLHPL